MSHLPPPPPPPLPATQMEDPPLRFAVRWTFIVAGVILSLFLLGLPLVFGALCAAVAPSRGRRWDTGLNYGMWFGIFYLIYLAFQPRA